MLLLVTVFCEFCKKNNYAVVRGFPPYTVKTFSSNTANPFSLVKRTRVKDGKRVSAVVVIQNQQVGAIGPGEGGTQEADPDPTSERVPEARRRGQLT